MPFSFSRVAYAENRVSGVSVRFKISIFSKSARWLGHVGWSFIIKSAERRVMKVSLTQLGFQAAFLKFPTHEHFHLTIPMYL